jgi:hypothetical protein
MTLIWCRLLFFSPNKNLLSRHFLRCALVQGRGIAFRHSYYSAPKGAGEDSRDDAVVPFK